MKNKNPRRGQAAGAEAVDQRQKKQSTKSFIASQSSETLKQATEPSIDSCGFLRLILPERGLYVAMIIEPQGRKYNRFAATIEELWEIIKNGVSRLLQFWRSAQRSQGNPTRTTSFRSHEAQCE